MPLQKPITVICREIHVNAAIEMHSHSWGQFIYASKGVMLVSTNSDRFIIPPEQGVWIPPEVKHQVMAITHVQLSSFYFSKNVLQKLPINSCVFAINQFLKVLIYEARNVVLDYKWTDADGLLLRLIVDKLAVAPIVKLHLPFPTDKRLLSILAMLQQQPSNRYTLPQWGAAVGASSRTLSRLFKRETGLTFSAWRQRLHVQIAISKLSQGLSVSNIALYLGYESVSAFIYMFKKNTDVTPSHYREVRYERK